MTNELKVLITIGVATVVLFVGAIWWMTGQNPDSKIADPGLLQRTDSHQTSTASAQVTLVEFGDFQCPSCAAVHPGVKALLAKYPTQLKLVFRNFPLSMHANAQIAAEAAEAAGAQGKYWEMHDWLYEHEAEWNTANKPQEVFAGQAKNLGLNVDQFNQALTDHSFAKVIQQDAADGNNLGVDATPTFYLNGKKLTSSLLELQAKIDEAIKAAK
jgi:protein-disulfide isomerase